MSGVSLACALVAGLGIAYAVEEWRRLRAGTRLRFVGRGQAIRRIVGSLLVAALMALVDLGLEVVEPTQRPILFAGIWLVAALMVVVLIGLALIDLREIRVNEQIDRAVHAARSEGPASSSPEEGDRDGSGPS